MDEEIAHKLIAKIIQMRKKIWERVVPLSKATREWDIDFWQAQKSEVRFRVAFDMLADFYRMRGKKINADTLRLQRTVERLQQAQG